MKQNRKRIILILLVVAIVFALFLSNGVIILSNEAATLHLAGSTINDSDKRVTQTLTNAETRNVKWILAFGEYQADGAGCPFSEDTSIAFGDRIIAVSTDDCPTVWDITNNKYYTLSESSKDYIDSLFEKYAGCFPAP